MFRVSIITVNYNNDEGLEKTIDSVFSQTYSFIEYIVIDGGSKDASFEIIKKRESRINYWVSEPDRGVYHAMNKGLEVATGDYLIFLNSGDYFYNNYVLEEISKYLNTGVDIIFGDINLIKNNNVSEIITYPDKLRFSFLSNYSICHQAIFYKKSIFQKVGNYSEYFPITADWVHYIVAIIKFNCTYLHIPVVISNYPLNGISVQPDNALKLDLEKKEFLQSEFSLFIDDYKDFAQLNNDKRVVTLSKLKNYPIISKIATAGLMFIALILKVFFNEKDDIY